MANEFQKSTGEFEFQKSTGEFQLTGKGATSSMLRSARDYRKSLEEISFEWAEFSKRSVSQAIEAQAQLAKKAFGAYILELTKFSMLGLYGPFSRDGSSDGPGAEETRDRGAPTSRTRAASQRNQGNNNRKASSRSDRGEPRTAAQRASTQRKTGAAKTRKAKRKAPAARAR